MNTSKLWRESVVKMFQRRGMENVIGMGCGDGFVCEATNGDAGFFVQGKADRQTKNRFVALTGKYHRHTVTNADRLRWALEPSARIMLRGDFSPLIQKKYLAPITVLSCPVAMHIKSKLDPVIFTFKQTDCRYVVMPMRRP